MILPTRKIELKIVGHLEEGKLHIVQLDGVTYGPHEMARLQKKLSKDLPNFKFVILQPGVTITELEQYLKEHKDEVHASQTK